VREREIVYVCCVICVYRSVRLCRRGRVHVHVYVVLYSAIDLCITVCMCVLVHRGVRER